MVCCYIKGDFAYKSKDGRRREGKEKKEAIYISLSDDFINQKTDHQKHKDNCRQPFDAKNVLANVFEIYCESRVFQKESKIAVEGNDIFRSPGKNIGLYPRG